MSDFACAHYGINDILYNRVCPGTHRATAEGFARRHIAGLQKLVGELDAKLESEKEKNKMLLERLKEKDEIIQLLKEKKE